MFATRLRATQTGVQQALDAALASRASVPMVDAMRYALRGGKRLRAFLVLESAALHDSPNAMSAAAAV
jgi:farnesyl diphosphate synthase